MHLVRSKYIISCPGITIRAFTQSRFAAQTCSRSSLVRSGPVRVTYGPVAIPSYDKTLEGSLRLNTLCIVQVSLHLFPLFILLLLLANWGVWQADWPIFEQPSHS
jgi:hypothetical protein